MALENGVAIFDVVARGLLSSDSIDPRQILTELLEELDYLGVEDIQDSLYFDDPLVQELFKELYPTGFTNES